ncbi:hypothetical protein F5884DRAFT_812630 [Xylogone sp. PMI_703]|nr:hypothetical protein F5884DRAFT_812630 [Xylogone sp. PMI_703]
MAPRSGRGGRRHISTFVCQYCTQQFKRLEHVQRHERTHTKETPYDCPCGRSFARRDLLTRHKRSAHAYGRGFHADPTGTGDNGAMLDSRYSGQSEVTVCPAQISSIEPTVSSTPYQDQHSEATQIITSPNYVPVTSVVPQSPDDNTRDHEHQRSELLQYGVYPFQNEQHGIPDSDARSFSGPGNPNMDIPIGDLFNIPGQVDEHNLFLDDLDSFSCLYSCSASINTSLSIAAQPAGLFSHHGEQVLESDIRSAPPPNDQDENRTSLSRFGSPLPSLASQTRSHGRLKSFGIQHPWKISAIYYQQIKANLTACSCLFPEKFVLPSRHSLSRYLEGCMKGMQLHLPFLHIPTFCAVQATPELLLSMAAIGAQFRFDLPMGLSLFYAAKAAILYQVSIIEVDNCNVHSLSTGALSETHALCPSSTLPSAATLSKEPENTDRQSANDSVAGCGGVEERRLQLMQAILCLLVMGSWGPKKLLRETLGFQSLLSTLVREDNLSNYYGDDQHSSISTISSQELESCWRRWIKFESHRRIKLMSYTFLNLQCVAYNIPPLILTSELDCLLPSSAKEWNANSSHKWHQTHAAQSLTARTFQQSYQSLFKDVSTASANPPMSSAETYALITAILQRIFFIRQGCSEGNRESSIPASTVEEISHALLMWQAQWERSPESYIEPQSPTGPVSFNSTALLRMAWIRLHVDLGPCRNLCSRDPVLIASAFRNSPPLKRSAALTQSVLQAAHALSVPVRMGITFVAKTQTIFWSVQHSLSNLECAIFLSKWFQALALTANEQPLVMEEKALISMIRGMILESGLFLEEDFGSSADDESLQRGVQRLATAVALLWAEIFKGTHIFDIVTIIGESLRNYARRLEAAHSPLKRVQQ